MTTTTITPNPAPKARKRTLRRSIGAVVAAVSAATVLAAASAGTAGALTASDQISIGLTHCQAHPHSSVGNWVSWAPFDTNRNGYYDAMRLVASYGSVFVFDTDSDGRVDQLWVGAYGRWNGWFDHDEDGRFDTMYGFCGSRPIRRTTAGAVECSTRVACLAPSTVSTWEQIARWADYWFIGNRVR